MTMRAVREWQNIISQQPSHSAPQQYVCLPCTSHLQVSVFSLLLQTVFTSALSGAIGLALTLVFIPDVCFCNAQRRHALLPPRDLA